MPGRRISRPSVKLQGVAKIPQSARIPLVFRWQALTPFRQIRETSGNVGKVEPFGVGCVSA